MAESDGDLVSLVARAWAGLSLDDDEAAALADALGALRQRLDAMASEELRDTEPPLRFRAGPPPR